MNKSLLVAVIFALILCFSCGVMADAAIYDYSYGTVTDCSYDVFVATVDGGVNLREAPTTESGIICTIADFEQLHISQESSNGKGWGYTSYNGKSGWVALSQVSEYFPIKQTSYDVVVNAKSGLNLREGPYTTYDSYRDVPYGTLVHVGATYNGWGEVEYKGTYGWIALKYTVLPDDFVEEAPAEEEVVPIEEEPMEEATVTSLEKEDSGGIPIMTLLLGMIILVVVIAAVLIIIIVVKKK